MPDLTNIIGPEGVKAILADLDRDDGAKSWSARAQLPTKQYKLTFGTHMYPNPDFQAGYVTVPELSHLYANVGDVVDLTDDQYRAFKDKFVPVDNEAASVRDKDAKVLEDAKQTAAKTGQMVDPNQPIQAAKNPLTEELKAREAAAAAAKKN